MNRSEINEVFELNVTEKRWVALKTYSRDLITFLAPLREHYCLNPYYIFR